MKNLMDSNRTALALMAMGKVGEAAAWLATLGGARVAPLHPFPEGSAAKLADFLERVERVPSALPDGEVAYLMSHDLHEQVDNLRWADGVVVPSGPDGSEGVMA